MNIEVTKEPENLLEIKVTGKLTESDYRIFVPRMEELIKTEGKLRILFEMVDFHGWTASALWQDIKFDFKHFDDVERLALVGENKWQKGMAIFCKPFTTAEIKYFSSEQRDQALEWLKSS